MALFDTSAGPGRFLQIGHQPQAAGVAPDGYGQFVTVDALSRIERDRVRERLEKLRPDLITTGAEVIKAKADADAAAEAFRKELHAAVGGDGVPAALAVIAEAMSKQPAKAAPAPTPTQPAKK